jgi:hypothetical protein
MPNAKGHMVKAGFKKAATWGTAVAVAAGDGLYLLSESIQGQSPRILDKSAGGSVQMRGADISAQTFGGQLVLPPRYEGRWITLLALLLGTAGAPTGSGPYVHTLKPSNAIPGFGTLAIDKQVGANPVWEYDSVAVDTVQLVSQAGTGDQARAQVTFGLVARALNRGSSTNTSTQIGNLTFPTAGHLLHHNLVIRMNANADGALGAGHVLKVRGLDLTINRMLKKDLYHAGSAFIDQPDAGDFIDVTGTLAIDRYSADSPGLTEFLAGTYMKMDIEWTIGASAIFHLDLPYLQITGGDRAMSGPGLIANPIPFQAFKPSAAPTGMTGITDLIVATLTNSFAADYLA